jgi:hypothetical protein
MGGEMVRHLGHHHQVRRLIRDASILKCPIFARDSLVYDRPGKGVAHPFAWFYRSDLSYGIDPVRVGKECTCKNPSARTNSRRTLNITGAAFGRELFILDDVERTRSGDLLTDILESIRRVRWTCSKERR